MRDLHTILAFVALSVNGLAFAGGGVYLLRHRLPHGPYAHLLAAGQVALIGQAAVGLLLLSDGQRAPDRLHYLYGALALGAVLSPWLYAPQEPRHRLGWFVGASLLATGLSVRATLTGG